jgi:hypothetical protein
LRRDDGTGPGLGVGLHGAELEYLELLEAKVMVRPRVVAEQPTGAALPKENVARRVEVDRDRYYRV